MFEGAQVRLALGRMLLSSALLTCIVLGEGSRLVTEAVEGIAFDGDSRLGTQVDAGVRALLRTAPTRMADGADDPRAAFRLDLERNHVVLPAQAAPTLAGYPHGALLAPPFAAGTSRYEPPGALPGRGPPGHPGEVLPELPLG